MAVIDDVRRLSQLDVIFLGTQLGAIGSVFATWYKGRLQQANDGSWVFRSASTDGAIVGIQLGPVGVLWTSSETPIAGITVTAPFGALMTVVLQQVLPQELT
jgi:hypothetical protein